MESLTVSHTLCHRGETDSALKRPNSGLSFQRFSPTEFRRRLRAAKTLESLIVISNSRRGSPSRLTIIFPTVPWLPTHPQDGG